MLKSGIGKKVLTSLTWVGSANLVSQIISWALTIIIMRQLSSSDFGLMAMAMTFFGFLTMIGDFGLFASIVQSKEVSNDQLQEIFGFIIILNILFMAATYFCAPMISIYFSESRIIPILRTLCIVFVFIPFYIIPHSMLLREMNFKKISIIDVFCNLSGASTSLLFALSGHGVWSLVFGTLVQFFLRAITFNLASRNYFKPLFTVKRIMSMLSFSSFYTGSTILRYLFFKSDIIIAGKFIGSEAIGIYSIANQLAFTPVEKLSYVIPQIAFPAFSKMQDNLRDYSETLLKGIKLLNLIFFPCYIVLFILAEDIVSILLGQKWIDIILPFRILCVVMPLRAFEILFIPAMNGLGKSKINMKMSGLSLIIMASAFFFGLNWGYVGLCWSWVAGFTIIYVAMIIMCVKNLQIDMAAIIQAYKTPSIASAGVLTIGICFLYYYSHVMHPLLKITAFPIASFLLYFVSVFYIDKPIVGYIKNLLSNRKFR